MNGLDLFSGIGGLSLALNQWVKPITYCEIDRYCQGVLMSRMADESLRNAPIWDDIKTLDGNIFRGAVDIIYGGFPCQDISVAGRGKGLDGERSGLFFEIMRLAKEISPKFLFLENVPAITTRGGLQVVREIAAMGYDCRWCIISASSVGALHRRERWFLLAYSKHNGASTCEEWGSVGKGTSPRPIEQQAESIGKAERTSELSSNVANSTSESTDRHAEQEKETFPLLGICRNDGYAYRKSSKQTDKKTQSIETGGESRRGPSRQYWPFKSRDDWQEVVSEMGKCSNGIPNHVDRLRALGNAVVARQAKEAFKILMGITNEVEE